MIDRKRQNIVFLSPSPTLMVFNGVTKGRGPLIMNQNLANGKNFIYYLRH